MKKAFYISCIVVALAVIAVFGQTAWFDYIFLDDHEYTFACPFVKNGLTFAGIVHALGDFNWGGIWMPITFTTYMADISIFGSGPAGHHITSVILHAVNALIFFGLLLKIVRLRDPDSGALGTGDYFICALAAVLWAVHPLRAESVAWIASRKDLVFTFFTLLGLHAWLGERIVLAVVAMALAVMGKPTAMSFPFVVIALDLIVRRVPWKNRRRVVALAVMLAMTVAVGLLTCYSQTHTTGSEVKVGLIDVRDLNDGYGSLAWRCLNAAVALGMYSYHFLTAEGIHLLYISKVGKQPDDMWLGLAVLALVSLAFAYALFRNAKKSGFGGAFFIPLLGCALWFLSTIGPTLGVAGGFGWHAYADRFTYLPMMAVSVLLVIAVPRRALFLAPLTLLSAYYLCAGFFIASTYWKNLTIFERAAICDAGNFMARAELGAEYCKAGRVEEGLALLRDSIAMRPVYVVIAHLADSLAVRPTPENIEEIKFLCSKIPEDCEDDIARVKADDALGVVAMMEHRWTDAVALFRKVLAHKKAYEFGDDVPMRLGMCYCNMKDYASAKPIMTKLLASKRPEVKAKAQDILKYIWQRERPMAFQ